MGPSPVPMKPRPKSEDVSRFGGPNNGTLPPPQHQYPPGVDPAGYEKDGNLAAGQRPIHMQHGARSSPSLNSKCLLSSNIII